VSLPGWPQSPVGLLAARLSVFGAIFVLGVVLEVRGIGPYSERQIAALYAVVLAGFLVTLAAAAMAHYRSPERTRALYELSADGLLITALVYCTGGAASLFAFLYNVWIIHSALRLGPHATLGACALSMAAYGAVAWGPVLGVFPGFDPWSMGRFDTALVGTATHSAGFAIVSVLAKGLAREVERGRDELLELGELHRRIVDHVASGLLTVTQAGDISSFNREAERITGYRAEDVIGRPLAELFSGAAPAVLEPSLARESGTREQIRFTNRDGACLHLGFSSSVLRSFRGDPDGAIVIFQDLTRVVEMEAQLRRSERLGAVGQLAAGLAHEIRNPLGALSGAIELLASDFTAADAGALRLFRIVTRETERLNRLVSDFLEYARARPGASVPVPVAPILEDLAKLVSEDASRRVTLRIDAQSDVAALGDPDRLRQVLWNLVLNAIESEPRDGVVDVAVRERTAEGGAMVQITVADRGAGIAQDALERIFEPFFTTKPRGTGLGLATVHRLVEDGGGTLAVSSAVGQGTEVTVTLPRARASSAP
jgi:two-component system sensor histidine kinase PilS (NtrC family)